MSDPASNAPCPQCHAPLPADAPQGLCLRCLLTLGATTDDSAFEPLEPPGAKDPEAGLPASSGEPEPAHHTDDTPQSFGDFEVIDELGRGGMGIVFKARQKSLGRIVALKTIRLGADVDKDLAQRLRAEAAAAASLHHPHIVAIHEVNALAGQPYLVMQFIEGQNLARLSAACENRDVAWIRRATRWLRTVALAIQHAHDRGILHRDLKPSNILIDLLDEPHVTDFGLAKRLEHDSELTLSGQVLGSPNYMPPEQAVARKGKVGFRSDVYSLGAILYHLLTGRPPCLGPSLAETLQEVLTREPIALRLLNPAVPRDLETLCLKCLEKEPDRRYPTAAALAEDLERFLRDEPIRARPVGRAEKAWRWCRRKPALAGSLAALFVAITSGVIGISWQWRRAENESARARAAAQESTTQLRIALLNQARAVRSTTSAGRHFESYKAIAQAAAMNPPPDLRTVLRDEAIASLALTDLQLVRRWTNHLNNVPAQARFDSRLERYARAIGRDSISVRRVGDDTELARLSANGLQPYWIQGFSADGRFLSATYFDEATWIWDLGLGQPVQKTRPKTFVRFDADGCHLVTSTDLRTFLWLDVDTWRESQRVTLAEAINDIQFHPDHERLLAIPHNAQCVQVIGLKRGEVLQTLAGGLPMRGLTISPNGRLVAAFSDDGQILIWDLPDGAFRRKLDAHQRQITCLGFNHAGDTLVSLSWDGRVRLWDTRTGDLLVQRQGVGYQAQFSPDDRRLGGPITEDYLSLFEVAVHPEIQLLSDGHGAKNGASGSFSADGRLLAASISTGINLWDTATGTKLAILPAPDCNTAHLLPDGSALIATGNHGMFRWPIRRYVEFGTNVTVFGPRARLSPRGNFANSETSADGSHIALAHPDREEVIVVDLRNPNTAPVRLPDKHPKFLALSPDARLLAVGTWNWPKIKIWDLVTRTLVTELPTKSHAAIAFSPDGHWLAVSSDDNVLYDVGSWQPRLTLPRSRGAFAFSPDSSIVALENGTTIFRLFSTMTGETLATVEGPPASVSGGMRFSADGTVFAGLLGNGSSHLWDLRRIRHQLTAVHLDWNLPPFPALASAPSTNSFRVELK